jgi:outer membrane biosynthesis protein TonB
MNLDDDDDDLPVRLDAWRVPPPRAADRSSLFARVLSPAAPAARPRTRWIFAALAIANVVLAAIIVIVVSQRSTQTIVRVQAAGGGADSDAQTQATLRRLEAKLADIDQLKTQVAELAERVRQCELSTYKTTPRPRPVVPPAPSPPSDLTSCDEVSCTLSNFEGACCAKYRRPSPQPSPTPSTTATPGRALPDMLDRENITAGIASIRSLITTCGQQFAAAKGTVKVRVRVNPSGRAEDVLIASTPDPGLGGCVATAVRKAIFEPTFHGGAFTYPFVFGASP